MTDIKRLQSLLEKLNNYTVNSLEAGASLAAARRHYDVSIEHVLLKILEEGGGDIDHVLTFFHVDKDSFWQGLLANLETQRAGNQSKPGFSLWLYKWLEQSLVASTLYYNSDKIRSVALIDAVIELAPQLPGNLWQMLTPISLDVLREDYKTIIQHSVENQTYTAANKAVENKEKLATQGAGGDSALAQFTHDLVAKAEAGGIDPVLGRDHEIRLTIDILSRRRKNNPILVGEPGVGKTAIVEGLARLIVAKDVPDFLQNVRLLTLDLGLLQAGAGVKGEFENRLQRVIEEVQNSATPIILFIDEAHTIIGAGGSEGQSDAANLLKPALARGELRTIAATTWAEYKKYFERDAALARRFQLIKVDEPSEENAIVMMSGLKKIYQQHHNVLITDDAVEAAVKLSSRYINGRQLPDKAIDLIDTAAGRVQMGQRIMPSDMVSLQSHIDYLQQRLADLALEQSEGIACAHGLQQSLEEDLNKSQSQLAGVNQQWQSEQAVVSDIKSFRELIRTFKQAKQPHAGKIDWVRQAIAEAQSDLQNLQGEKPLMQPELNAAAIADVVSDWTGIPVGKMMKDDLIALTELEQRLSMKVVGQDNALYALAETIRTKRAGLADADTPMGVFLLTGSSGVGKTETARALADELFGNDRALITINMSEYQEAHTVAQLKGSPPGYVGYGEGGVLTEAVRQKPYSVVLLDEVEKAHPDVMNIFYQVFDKGVMRDGEGREIDFRNTIIMMTSNLATNEIVDLMQEQDDDTAWQAPSYATINASIRPSLLRHFAPALLGRMQVVPFLPLSTDALKNIVALKLEALATRLHTSHSIQLRCEPEVIQHLAEQAVQPDRGARAINAIIEQQLAPGIARSLLGFMAEDDMPDIITLALDDNSEIACTFATSVETSI